MSFMVFNTLPGWAMALSLAVHFAAGTALGVVYFRGLWWNARMFASGGRLTTTIGLSIVRLLLLGAVLTVASLEGALPLLTLMLGLLVARSVVMRRIGRTAR